MGEDTRLIYPPKDGLDLDDRIRNTIRKYRIMHSRDPAMLKVSKKMYMDLEEEYVIRKRFSTPWEIYKGQTKLYGVPVVVTGRKDSYDKNGCSIGAISI